MYILSIMFDTFTFDDTVICIKTATEYQGDAIMWAYAYQIEDVLFDTGCANAQAEFATYKDTTKINRVYVTHSHEDHVGCLSLFNDTEIYAMDSIHHLLMTPPQIVEFFQFVWGQPGAVDNVESMPSEFVIGDLQFKVIDLSGHFAGMIGFHEEEKGWLFSADAVPLPSRKQIAMPEENLPKMIDTMKKILTLNLNVLFDGHKGPIENPREHIEKRVNYLREIDKRIHELNNEGKSIEQIEEILEFKRPWYMEMTEGRFAFKFLIKSFLRDTVEED